MQEKQLLVYNYCMQQKPWLILISFMAIWLFSPLGCGTVEEATTTTSSTTTTSTSSTVSTTSTTSTISSTSTPTTTTSTTTTTISGSWTVVGQAGISGSNIAVSAPLILVSSEGTPVVAIVDKVSLSGTPELSVMYYTDDWHYFGDRGITVEANFIGQFSMALTIDRPLLVFAATNPSHIVKAYIWDKYSTPSSWVAWPNLNGGTNPSPDVVLSSDTAYCVESFVNNQVKVEYTAEPPSAWQTFGNTISTTGTAEECALSIDGGGKPFILFSADNETHVMVYSSGTWSELTSPGDLSPYPSLFATNDIPYIAFIDSSDNNKIKVKYYFSGDWHTLGSGAVSSGSGFSPVIKFYNSTAYVAFVDGDNNSKITVKRLVNNSWQLVGSAGFSPYGVDQSLAESRVLSLAVSSESLAYVAFMENDSTKNRITV